MAAGDPLDEDREDRFCPYCGALLPECCEPMIDGDTREEDPDGWAMCMRTGNTLMIPEWAEEERDGG